jgi:hypothetical protein
MSMVESWVVELKRCRQMEAVMWILIRQYQDTDALLKAVRRISLLRDKKEDEQVKPIEIIKCFLAVMEKDVKEYPRLQDALDAFCNEGAYACLAEIDSLRKRIGHKEYW